MYLQGIHTNFSSYYGIIYILVEELLQRRTLILYAYALCTCEKYCWWLSIERLKSVRIDWLTSVSSWYSLNKKTRLYFASFLQKCCYDFSSRVEHVRNVFVLLSDTFLNIELNIFVLCKQICHNDIFWFVTYVLCHVLLWLYVYSKFVHGKQFYFLLLFFFRFVMKKRNMMIIIIIW